ncbi:MAG: BREX protein BrxB domain-containing protein [Pseudonocardiaceae bacterium]
MSDFEERLRQVLEPILAMSDPRPRISAYHDMPYALFVYDPADEFPLRKQVRLLETRLMQKGKRVHRISLVECLDESMRSQRPLPDWYAAEREQGPDTTVETVHAVLSDYSPLVEHVTRRMPAEPDPLRDVVLILRAGALFPVYRAHSLLEQLMGRVQVPTMLFYPGSRDGAAGLRFMGILAAEHNYRVKIF